MSDGLRKLGAAVTAVGNTGAAADEQAGADLGSAVSKAEASHSRMCKSINAE